MGSARIRAPHRTPARGLACPQSPRPSAHTPPAFVTPAPAPRPAGTPRAQDVTIAMISHPWPEPRREGWAQPAGHVVMPRFQRGGIADPHTPSENDITKEKAHRFATCGRRASLPKVRVRLIGTAALHSYLDPENQ